MLRTVLWFLSAVIICILLIPIGLIGFILRINGLKMAKLACSLFLKWVYGAAGFKLEKHGIENIPDGPALFVGNHQGLFDTIIAINDVGGPKSIVAKKEAEKIPVIHLWMKVFMECIFIDRGNIRASLRAMQQVEEHLKNGKSVLIFPEGHRSKCSEVKEFHGGSLKPAIKAGVPIVPFVINGSYKAWDEKHRITPCRTTLTILPPIETKDLEGVKTKELAEEIRQQIQAVIDRENAGKGAESNE